MVVALSLFLFLVYLVIFVPLANRLYISNTQTKVGILSFSVVYALLLYSTTHSYLFIYLLSLLPQSVLLLAPADILRHVPAAQDYINTHIHNE
jgi:hypothetical protein